MADTDQKLVGALRASLKENERLRGQQRRLAAAAKASDGQHSKKDDQDKER